VLFQPGWNWTDTGVTEGPTRRRARHFVLRLLGTRDLSFNGADGPRRSTSPYSRALVSSSTAATKSSDGETSLDNHDVRSVGEGTGRLETGVLTRFGPLLTID
jgi:hypothetical protein